jgi:hypothetical protein
LGMLMNFYTGDKERIVHAFKRGYLEPRAGDRYVIASADFSFHLAVDELDQIVLSACSLLGYPPITLSDSIHADLVPVPASDPEAGIHEMSSAFMDLFASMRSEHAAKVYELWRTNLPEEPKASSDTVVQRCVRKVNHGIVITIIAIVITPIIAANWLFSPSFRKDRKQNRMKVDMAKKESKAAPEYTLSNAIEALINTCQTAKAHGKKVIYAWSI